MFALVSRLSLYTLQDHIEQGFFNLGERLQYPQRVYSLVGRRRPSFILAVNVHCLNMYI